MRSVAAPQRLAGLRRDPTRRPRADCRRRATSRSCRCQCRRQGPVGRRTIEPARRPAHRRRGRRVRDRSARRGRPASRPCAMVWRSPSRSRRRAGECPGRMAAPRRGRRHRHACPSCRARNPPMPTQAATARRGSKGSVMKPARFEPWAIPGTRIVRHGVSRSSPQLGLFSARSAAARNMVASSRPKGAARPHQDRARWCRTSPSPLWSRG